tara:strand:+ start:11847 stop:12503 length:657 start_codon:yes stop_codon:yes gene_type:complete
MSISFPKTWSSGEVLTASDTKGNLDAMKNKAQKLSAGDVVPPTAAWMTTAHIMQGRYDSVTNITNNVSGVFGGRNNAGTWQNTSYVTRWMMPSGYSSATKSVSVPLTCIQVDIVRPATVMFQWWINHQSPKDGDGTDGSTQFYCYENTLNSLSTVHHAVPEQLSTNNALIDGSFLTNGHNLFDMSSGILNYGIGLTAFSTAGKCQQVAWGISIEVFYM